MITCAICGYANNNGPPVRVRCISCFESLGPAGTTDAEPRSALDRRAKFMQWFIDPLAGRRGKHHEQKTPITKSPR